MRRKRLLLWVFVAVGAVALGLLTVVVLTSPKLGVTQQNYRRTTYGMTLAEVQGLLGGEGEELGPMSNNFVRSAFLAQGRNSMFLVLSAPSFRRHLAAAFAPRSGSES